MKIKLEDADIDEIEITIRGNIKDKTVSDLVSILKENKIASKIILFDEEKEILADIKEVLYFEISNRKTYASLENKKLLSKYSLSEILSLFSNQGIIQISKSLLVNINHVKSLEAEFSGNYLITLKGDEKLVVSRLYMKEFRKAIMRL